MQYLGPPVTNNRQNPLVEETTTDFTCKVNGFSSYFDKVNRDVKSVFFKLYCTGFYGAQVYVLYVMELLRFLILHIGRPLGGYGGSRIEPVESFCHTLYVSMYALIMNKLV